MQFHIADSQKAVRCSDEISQKARSHAWRAFPTEAVGCVVDGEYQELKNIAEVPGASFVVDEYPDEVEAIIHSHPDMPPHPSAADMRQQQAMSVPWGIIGVDGRTAQTTEVEQELKFSEEIPEGEKAVARSIIWHGLLNIEKSAAVRFLIRGNTTGLVVDGILELPVAPGARVVDVWMERVPMN